MQSLQKISIAKKDDSVFFHVIGDNTEYMDLDSILGKHPEMSDEVEKQRFDLSRKINRAREESGSYGGLFEGARQ